MSLGADVDGYRCSFASTCKGDALAWAAWTLAVRELVASLWAEVESYAIPASAPPKPAPIVRPVYAHAYPLNVPVDAGLADAYSAVLSPPQGSGSSTMAGRAAAYCCAKVTRQCLADASIT